MLPTTPNQQDELTQELKRLNHLLTVMNARQSPVRLFFNGILTALGTFVGATVVVGIVVYLLSRIPLIPMLGNFLADLVAEIMKYMPKQNFFF